MKYLVNAKSKKHMVAPVDTSYVPDGYYCVQADSEGWIAHTRKECPLPDDAMCDTKWDDGMGAPTRAAGDWKWIDPAITHYRPILTEQAEPTPKSDYDPRSVSFNLLKRLQAAHESAQQIPFLEAELRRELAGMGYTLGNISPFVEPANSTAVIAEPEAAGDPEQDMSDWRNWREGDVVQITRDCFGAELLEGDTYPIDEVYAYGIKIRMGERRTATFGYTAIPENIQFHSRPAEGE